MKHIQRQQETHPEKTDCARPSRVVRYLSPTPYMHHSPLIHATTDTVDYRSDQSTSPPLVGIPRLVNQDLHNPENTDGSKRLRFKRGTC